MAKSPEKSKARKPRKTGPATESIKHVLLKASEPDEMLLLAYKKVEKRLAGQLEDQIATVIGCDVEIPPFAAEKQLYTDWLDNADPANIYLQYQLGVSDVPLWVRVSRLFLNGCVDCFFGGQFNPAAQIGEELSRSERVIIERLGHAMAISFTKSWSVLCETSVRYIDFVETADEIEMVLDDPDTLVSSVSIAIGEQEIPAISIAQTIDGLVAMEPQLHRSIAKQRGDFDPAWQQALKQTVDNVYLPVRSVLARPTMDLSKLSQLAVGDILPVAPTDNVPLIVGDRVFAHGSIGEQNGGVAFQIKQFS